MTPFQKFESNIYRLENQKAIFSYLSVNATSALDLTDLLRSEFVQLVSALDHYVHELSIQRMLDIFDATREPTDAYKKYCISMATVQQMVGLNRSVAARSIFEQEIRTRFNLLSFQKPDKIADAVRLFSPIELWKSVGHEIGIDSQGIKTQISLIIDRRNKIAHESDMRPDRLGETWSIDRTLVDTAKCFIIKVCSAMDKLLI